MGTTETIYTLETLKLIGGNLALDFANTVPWDGSTPLRERLTHYDDLLRWAQRVAILSQEEITALAAEGARQPEAADAMLARAIALRGAIHRLFVAQSHGRAPDRDDLALLNSEIGQALAHSRVAPAGGGFAWEWFDRPIRLDRPLWPVVRAAAELLTSPQINRVRECAGEHCGWLFVDTSKSGRRRWCTMEDCGNRAKARRHYQRQQAGRTIADDDMAGD